MHLHSAAPLCGSSIINSSCRMPGRISARRECVPTVRCICIKIGELAAALLGNGAATRHTSHAAHTTVDVFVCEICWTGSAAVYSNVNCAGAPQGAGAACIFSAPNLIIMRVCITPETDTALSLETHASCVRDHHCRHPMHCTVGDAVFRGCAERSRNTEIHFRVVYRSGILQYSPYSNAPIQPRRFIILSQQPSCVRAKPVAVLHEIGDSRRLTLVCVSYMYCILHRLHYIMLAASGETRSNPHREGCAMS